MILLISGERLLSTVKSSIDTVRDYAGTRDGKSEAKH